MQTHQLIATWSAKALIYADSSADCHVVYCGIFSFILMSSCLSLSFDKSIALLVKNSVLGICNYKKYYMQCSIQFFLKLYLFKKAS